MILSDICDVYSGFALKTFNDINEGLPVIKIGNIMSDGSLNLLDCQYTEEIVKEKYYAHKGDIFVALSGATTGKVGIMTSKEKYIVNQRVGVVRRKQECIPESYIKYFLLMKTNEILDDASGCAQPNISPKQIAQYKLPSHSHVEMMGIVEKLDCVSHVIEGKKTELIKLDDLIKARFVEMFGNPMINDKGYPLKRYGDLFELNAGGTPSKSHPEYWEDGTIPWIGSNMCQNTYIYENDGNYITEEGFRHSSARMFPIDTVLVALVGATIGKTALLKFETTTNQNVLGIRGIKESGYTPEFVYYYTQGLYEKFLAISDGGFAMASKGFISNLQIPIVDLSDQMEFTSFANQVDKSKVVIQKSLDETQLLFDSLMQEYFG